ncbi:unnamed protein product [marine sediment metagenome]|uniref:Pathogenicity locus n=1 Tax=marine sediment metagenome TaxID=412755 RepID=X1MJ44_9ZZZZ
MESSSLQELEQIPGVGKTIAQDMQNIGIHSIDALKGRQAELYDRLCEFKASPVDRCMLYVFNWLYTMAKYDIPDTSDENDWKDKQ